MLTGDSVSVSENTSEHTVVDHQDEDVKTILGFVPSIPDVKRVASFI